MDLKKYLPKIIVVCVLIAFAAVNLYKSNTAPDEEQVQTAVTEQTEAAEETENEQETEDDDSILPFGIKLGTGNIVILAAIGAAVGINWLKEQSKRNSHTED